MKQNELVSTDFDVITTLCRLDLLSEYMSTNDLPLDTDIDADFLNKIPEFLTNRTFDVEKLNKLKEMFPNENLNEDMSWKLPLFSGYQVRNEVLDIVRSLGPHPQEILGLRAFIHAFEAYECHPEMPHMHDGFDNQEVMLKVMQSHPEDKDEFPLDFETLVTELTLGAGGKRDILDTVLRKWLKNPDILNHCIMQDSETVCQLFAQRLPTLHPETVAQLGAFVLDHRSLFPTDKEKSALFLCTLVLDGRSSPNPFFRSNENLWDSIFDEAESFLADEYPERRNYLEGTKLKKKVHRLLYFQPHHQREENLLVATKQALEHESDESLEKCIILIEVCQVLYRHLLFKGSRSALLAFETSTNKFGELLQKEMKLESSRWSDRIPSFTRYWLWFEMAICLFNHRLELRKKNNVKEELRWIRALMLAAKQIRQVGPEYCKCLMSEATSRMLSLKRRPSLSWTKDTNEVRAKLLREIAQRAHDDIADTEVWIVNELTPHVLYGFDYHNPLPHILRGKGVPEPKATTDLEKEHKRVMISYWDQYGEIYRIPDNFVDLTMELRYRSASNAKIDKIIGPNDALQISEVAALLWNSVSYMGESAQPIGSFAGRYPEFLSPHQKKTAEAFLLKTQEDIYNQNRSGIR